MLAIVASLLLLLAATATVTAVYTGPYSATDDWQIYPSAQLPGPVFTAWPTGFTPPAVAGAGATFATVIPVWCFCAAISPTGELWAGCFGSISKWDGATLTPVYTVTGSVYRITWDSEGRLWYTSSAVKVILTDGTSKVYALGGSTRAADGVNRLDASVSGLSLFGMLLVPDGSMYVSFAEGLMRIFPTGNIVMASGSWGASGATIGLQNPLSSRWNDAIIGWEGCRVTDTATDMWCLVADRSNCVLRKVTFDKATWGITNDELFAGTVASCSFTFGSLAATRLSNPTVPILDKNLNWFASSTGATRAWYYDVSQDSTTEVDGGQYACGADASGYVFCITFMVAKLTAPPTGIGAPTILTSTTGAAASDTGFIVGITIAAVVVAAVVAAVLFSFTIGRERTNSKLRAPAPFENSQNSAEPK